MPAQGLLTTIAGLSLSLAGFASLIAWLRDDQTRWDPINLWRVKTIVRHALTITFMALALHPVRELTGDDAATIRIGAAGLIAFTLSDMARNRRRDPVIWPSASAWRVSMAFSAAYLVLMVATLAIASLGLLQVAFLLVLLEPAGIFYNFVSELGGTGDAEPQMPGPPTE